ncbi:hypothetical protein E2562_035208 [Oryza meyeriana var. granulata]|uniref:Uncharacterized protein n=1 Tax=Oryza meyeriana var. granulata TaxID=110450 RepID=A0A6G1DS11_9ORYZ|nr:hypothetical protein E2562_035208 [Oryza meyeriana var. granulata]
MAASKRIALVVGRRGFGYQRAWRGFTLVRGSDSTHWAPPGLARDDCSTASLPWCGGGANSTGERLQSEGARDGGDTTENKRWWVEGFTLWQPEGGSTSREAVAGLKHSWKWSCVVVSSWLYASGWCRVSAATPSLLQRGPEVLVAQQRSE